MDLNLGKFVEAIENFTGVSFPIFSIIVIIAVYFVLLFKGEEWGILPDGMFKPQQSSLSPQLAQKLNKLDNLDSIKKEISLNSKQLDSMRVIINRLEKRIKPINGDLEGNGLFDIVGFGYRGNIKVAQIEVADQKGNVEHFEWECYEDGTLKNLDELREKAELLSKPLAEEPEFEEVEPAETEADSGAEEPEVQDESTFEDDRQEFEDDLEGVEEEYEDEEPVTPEEEDDVLLQLSDTLRNLGRNVNE